MACEVNIVSLYFDRHGYEEWSRTLLGGKHWRISEGPFCHNGMRTRDVPEERSARGIRPLEHDALGAVVHKDTREGRRTQEMPYSVRLEYGVGAGEFTIDAQLPNVDGEHDHCQGQGRPDFVKARFASEEIGYAKKDHRE